MGHLTEQDCRLIKKYREAGVLTDVNGHLLDQTNGVIMIVCSDGDQMPDIFSFQEKMESEQRPTPRVHTLALNGGALLIPVASPVATGNEDQTLIKHLKQAMELKGIKTVALYAHAPCGAAGLVNLNFEQVIDLLIKAKTRLKQEIAGLATACFCHVDHGNGKKRTYFVSRDKWLNWKK